MALFRSRTHRHSGSRLAALSAMASNITSRTGTAQAASGNIVRPKQPGETKVVAALGGDLGHNPIPLEINIRSIFTPANWRIIVVRATTAFSPALIADADLLITSRHGRPDDRNWSPDGLVEEMSTGDHFWSDTNVAAIIANVRRGMGYLALHNSLFCQNHNMTGFMGIEPIMHNEIQPLWVYDLHESHPITRGLEPFLINLDEQFAAIIKNPAAVSLFQTQAIHDKRRAVGGWSLEQEKGRIVALLPGHMKDAYQVAAYRDILWRAGHWAMHRDPTLRGE